MNLHITGNLALDSLSELMREADAPQRDPRAELAAQFIPTGSQVLDLGGGGTRLQRLLPPGCRYAAADLAPEFPVRAAADADILLLLGVLEQVVDLETLFTDLRFSRRDLVLSYPATDLLNGEARAARGFANHLSFYELATLFDRYGYRIVCTAPLDGSEVLMRLTRSDRMASSGACSVAVVTAGDNAFGERLGMQMLNALLPGEAEVHRLTFDTLDAARERYDLVVLGVGGGLFQPFLDDAVSNVLDRGKARIGIFGTQYRELLPRVTVDRVIERLDTWYALAEDDVLMYGRGRNNVVHLGDWLIDQFPFAAASVDEPLRITEEVRESHALDQAIAVIQKHKAVFSTRPQLMLCALTAAEMAAYAEPTVAELPGIVSGSFRSLLTDIFGRTYPENDFFLVDREAVRRYKARVHRNVASVEERIGALIGNVVLAAG